MDDAFLTIAEVAAILKLNQQTVRNWIDQGSLPAVRVVVLPLMIVSNMKRSLER